MFMNSEEGNQMILKTRKLTAAMIAAGVLSAAVLVAPVNAQTVGGTNTGSAVVVPYYTINNGWQTLLNVTNTSANSLAIKVRMHEARNSRDVLDFNVALSPYDVWTAFISMDANGRPVLRTEDRSCTIPISVRDSGASASELAYSDNFRDRFPSDGIERMTEGYVEILVMGEEGRLVDGQGLGFAPSGGDRGATAWYAKHVDGEPRNCGIVQSDFLRTTGLWGGGNADPIPGEAGSGNPLARRGAPNGNPDVGYGPIVSEGPLKVNASLINQDRGIAAGIESLHVAEFGVGENLVTAQQFPWFLEPSLASGDGLWTKSALFALEDDIGVKAVANEWTSNPRTGAASDWVVTFPTKRFRVDNDAFNIQAACNVWRNLASGGGAASVGNTDTIPFPFPAANSEKAVIIDADCPIRMFDELFQENNNGMSPITVSYDVYDREEGTFQVQTDGVVISPAPPPEVTIDSLKYEANVIKIGRNVAELDSALNSAIAASVETNQLTSNANTGWMNMTFVNADAVPTSGFIFKLRDLGDPTKNYGQATEHAYTFSTVNNVAP
jgi:hypothetical protein